MLCGAMQALKAAGVDFIVAPYEADAQMAYLALSGKVHAVCLPASCYFSTGWQALAAT